MRDLIGGITRSIIAVNLFIPGLAVATTKSADREKLVEYCLAGMRNSREQLRSGEYSAKGTLTSVVASTNKVRAQINFGIDCVFDGDNLRFTRHERSFNGTYIRNKMQIYTYAEGEQSLVIDSVETESTKRFRAFDVRAIGILSLFELDDWGTADKLFELLTDTKKVTRAEAVKTPVGYIVSWIVRIDDKNELKRTYWVDSEHGFTPTKMEVRARNMDQSWEKAPLVITNQTTWREIGNAWVPIVSQMTDLYGTRRAFFNFDWKSVNRSLAAKEFAVTSLNLPKGTYIVDNTLGKPIIDSIVGKAARNRSSSIHADWRLVLFLINLFVIVIIVIVIVRRRFAVR